MGSSAWLHSWTQRQGSFRSPLQTGPSICKNRATRGCKRGSNYEEKPTTQRNASTPSRDEFEAFYNDHYNAISRCVARRVPASRPPPSPICAINNFFISGKQSDGGAGSYDTYVYLTNSGSTCRLVPIGARGYNAATHPFVGTAASISKPEVTPGQLFPYATRH